MTRHRITPHRDTLHGTFSPEWAPVLTIDPGDTVIFTTLDAGWGLEAHHRDGSPRAKVEPREPIHDNGHALCGPIFIRGARPGMNLVVDIGPIRTGAWGWTVGGGWTNGINERLGLAEEELMLHWSLDPDANTGTDQFDDQVTLDPFFGVMGMPGAAAEPVPSWTPRVNGGNLDCKELRPGARLYLPIAVEGGLFSAGDGHALQGDGEVSSTAIECPFDEAELTLSLNDEFALATPIAWTPDAWIVFGFHERLDEATVIALDGMLDLLCREARISRHRAIALASVLVDVHVTQIVNGTRGVHAIIRHDALARIPVSSHA